MISKIRNYANKYPGRSNPELPKAKRAIYYTGSVEMEMLTVYAWRASASFMFANYIKHTEMARERKR